MLSGPFPTRTMKLSTRNDVRSPPSSGAPSFAGLPLSKPPAPRTLTSGYGVVIEKEEKLRVTNRDCLGEVHGAESSGLWRILRDHQILLQANQALLRQRCEQLPHAERFADLQDEQPASSQTANSLPPGRIPSLPDLVSRHTSLIGDIDALIARAERGENGEPMLAEIEHNHAEMARMLMALISEDEAPPRERPARSETAAWDNEGGGPRPGQRDARLRKNPAAPDLMIEGRS